MKLAAIVLAAGKASRFGSDKMQVEFRGKPLVSHAIAAAQNAPVERVIVVCGPDLPRFDAVGGPPVEYVRIASAAMSDSLKAGIAAVADCDGAFVFLGDMPLVPHGLTKQLAERLDGAYAVLPRLGDQAGHPALLSARAFCDIMTLSGDRGAAPLLRGRNDVEYINTEDRGILADVDRAQDLTDLETKGAEKR